jgi:hypothetical protein
VWALDWRVPRAAASYWSDTEGARTKIGQESEPAVAPEQSLPHRIVEILKSTPSRGFVPELFPPVEERTSPAPADGNVPRRSRLLVNREGKPRNTGGHNDADGRTVRDNYVPAAGAPEAHGSTPAIRCDPDEGHLETVAGDVWVWATGIAGDGRDYAEDVSSGRDRDES